MSEAMSVPKLRFKEFDGDWTFKNLSDVSSKPLYGMNSAATDFDGENKYLRITDIDEESHRFKFTKLSSPSDVIEEKYILQEGDLLFARTGASVGKSYIYDPDDGKVVFAGFLIKFGLKESVIPYFIFTQTLSEKFNNWVITNSMRSGQPGINAEEYSKWQIAFTSKPEQTKIASFLSAVDEKISQLTQKHALLSQYKQGMMQKLFSQQIRFKADDGSEFGEWETKLIKDIADVKGGKRLPKGYSLINENTGHPYITVSDMNRSYSIDSTNIRYVPLEVVDTIKRYTITDKDIFISVAGTLGIIGKIPTEFNGANLTENADKLTNLKCHQEFLIYLLDSGYLSALIESTATTSAQPKLALYAIEQLEIQMPCLEEQTKIANFLSSIDQKVDVVAQQIEQAKQWKKGLLQQMFV